MNYFRYAIIFDKDFFHDRYNSKKNYMAVIDVHYCFYSRMYR